jgi:ribosomal protein S12 methylthiotransferase
VGRKIHFTSLGCARNLVDTEVMLGLSLKAGLEATDRLEEADYLVVNTCGFLSAAREESCETIHALLREKKRDAKVIVAGCMVQKEGAQLRERFPEAHYFLGSGDVEGIVRALASAEPGASVTTARSYLEQGEVPRQLSTPKHYAYLKIAEGCAKQCAFCIIPKIKGPLRSKSRAQVLKEFRALLSQGAQEIILIAQDLGDWGKERGEKLEDLIACLLEVRGDFWLRFLYLYPDEITEELLALMERDARICRYLDMPMQHINDAVLKAMRRKTSRAAIIRTLDMLRARFPDIVIRTSLMVGFPGETEEQFEELCRFVQEYPLDNVGIFKYSREEGSPSAKMAGHVSEEVKQERYERLAHIQQKIAHKRSASYIGRTLQVVVEGYHPETDLLMRGRFYGQCPEIDGQVIINDGQGVHAFGKRYAVEITDASGYDLVGRVVC